MNITISSVHCRCATRILFRRLRELKPKDQFIPKNIAIGHRAKQRGLTHEHHRRDLVWRCSQMLPGNFYALSEKQLLFEHHSNQVWYLLEPFKKNNVLNFESQLKN